MVEISRAFAALADPTRLAVFECIRGSSGSMSYDAATGRCTEGMAAGLVRGRVPCAPSTLTHHLNALRDAGLIRTERKGRQVFACVPPEALLELAGYFCGRGCELSGQKLYSI